VFDWPKDGELIVPGLASRPIQAFLLSGNQPLKAAAEDHRVKVFLPAEAPDKIATVVALDVEGRPPRTGNSPRRSHS
jgi:alpha-L-fucosidase